MVDYRSRLESKLNAIDSKIKPLEEERARLMGALSVLQELDSENAEAKTSKDDNSQTSTLRDSLIDTVAKILESSGRMMTTREIEDQLEPDRKVARGSVYIALTRLKNRDVVAQDGRKWWFL